jgi:hypothetical protein
MDILHIMLINGDLHAVEEYLKSGKSIDIIDDICSNTVSKNRKFFFINFIFKDNLIIYITIYEF